MNFEIGDDFIEDDENTQLVYEKVGENRIQYVFVCFHCLRLV